MTRKLAFVLTCVLAMALPALAAGTSHWTHASEADFKQGKMHNVVVTSLGDVKLSRAVKMLLEQDPKVTSVNCLAEAADGTVYAGTGPEGVLLALKGDAVATLLTVEDENITSLLPTKEGDLLIGTGGEHGRIFKLEKAVGKPKEIFKNDDVQYIWQLVQTPDGMIYAATGPKGQLYQLKADGPSEVIFSCDEHNLLSMVSDGKDTLYIGTDPNGLVYKINRKSKDIFVLFDSSEPEIGALLLDAKGNLYVATSQASDADEQTPDNDEPGKGGRPEGMDNTTPLPKPAPGKPPAKPDPNPGDPNPIPRHGLRFMFAEEMDRTVPDLPGGKPGPVKPPVIAPPVPGGKGPKIPNPPVVGAGQNPAGNAIYRIDPDGFVTEIFRQPVMFLSMIEKDGALIVGTGSDGLVYQINPEADETSVIAKVDPKQVSALLATRSGRVIMGLSNIGGIAAMTSGFAADGTLISPVLDAGQISRFGKIRLHGSLPSDAALTIATRSGNLQEPSEKTWSKWSDEMPAAEFLQTPSPTARFLQYRATFKSKDGKNTAVLDSLDVAYLSPNQAPQIKSIKIGGDSDKPPVAMPGVKPFGAAQLPAEKTDRHMLPITWEASDPNNDTIEYTLYYRQGTTGPWVQLAEKLKEATYTWDTRTASDGRYQIRVVASDAKSNPKGQGKTGSRVSSQFIIDNTPPVIGDIKTTVEGRSVKVEARVVDRTGTVATVDYAVDSKDDWQAAEASDKIFDSPEEGVVFTADGLSAGAHQITIRATDDHGNQSYETVQVKIGEQKQ
ncbi:MAG: Ig-like domain-containing protein [Tepidisphaerales bacterium]